MGDGASPSSSTRRTRTATASAARFAPATGCWSPAPRRSGPTAPATPTRAPRRGAAARSSSRPWPSSARAPVAGGPHADASSPTPALPRRSARSTASSSARRRRRRRWSWSGAARPALGGRDRGRGRARLSAIAHAASGAHPTVAKRLCRPSGGERPGGRGGRYVLALANGRSRDVYTGPVGGDSSRSRDLPNRDQMTTLGIALALGMRRDGEPLDAVQASRRLRGARDQAPQPAAQRSRRCSARAGGRWASRSPRWPGSCTWRRWRSRRCRWSRP